MVIFTSAYVSWEMALLFSGWQFRGLPRTVMPRGVQGVLGGLHHGWVLRSVPDVVVGTSPKITRLGTDKA